MFHFLFELFTLFFLSFLFQFLLVYSNFFSQKSINNLFENKLPAMGKLVKGEKKKQLAHSLLKTMKIFLRRKPVSIARGSRLTVRNNSHNSVMKEGDFYYL